MVIVDDPDAVAVLLTPDLAGETSDRLLTGAARAQGQRVRMRREQGRDDGG